MNTKVFSGDRPVRADQRRADQHDHGLAADLRDGAAGDRARARMGRVHRGRRTPWVAIVFVAASPPCSSCIGDLSTLADTTVLLLLLVFVVRQRRRAGAAPRPRRPRPLARADGAARARRRGVPRRWSCRSPSTTRSSSPTPAACSRSAWCSACISRALAGPAEPIDPARADGLSARGQDSSVASQVDPPGRPLSAFETGQFSFAAWAACWNVASSAPGTRPDGVEVDLLDREAVALLEDLHLGLGADRVRHVAALGAGPARGPSRSSSACAAAISSSGLVPPLSLEARRERVAALDLPARALERPVAASAGRPATPPARS